MNCVPFSVIVQSRISRSWFDCVCNVFDTGQTNFVNYISNMVSNFEILCFISSVRFQPINFDVARNFDEIEKKSIYLCMYIHKCKCV